MGDFVGEDVDSLLVEIDEGFDEASVSHVSFFRRYFSDVREILSDRTLPDDSLMVNEFAAQYLEGYSDLDEFDSSKASSVLLVLSKLSDRTDQDFVDYQERKDNNLYMLNDSIFSLLDDIEGDFTEYDYMHAEAKAIEYAVADLRRNENYSDQELHDRVEDLLEYDISLRTIKDRIKQKIDTLKLNTDHEGPYFVRNDG